MGKRREQRKERNEALKNRVQEASEHFFSEFSTKMKIDKVLTQIQNWAENNRKAMFSITISFLVGLVFLTFNYRSETGTKKESIDEMNQLFESNFLYEKEKKTTDKVQQLLLMQKYRNELREIFEKDTVTMQDSLRVTEIYNIIKQNGNETK